MANDRGTYREIEHTADLGVEITAADLPALFASAGEALYALIADPATIENREAIKVSATGANPEDLLHTWLCELLALFNVEGFVGKRCEIDRTSATDKFKGESAAKSWTSNAMPFTPKSRVLPITILKCGKMPALGMPGSSSMSRALHPIAKRILFEGLNGN